MYRDGTYSADGVYGSRPSTIGVTVTLDQDVVTDVEVKPHATEATSHEYQQAFADAVPRVVVGRRIDDVQVGRLAGASGVPIGFNDAILHIRA
jgi:hypothetical protein